MTREEAIEYLHKLFMQADITDAYGDMDDTEPYETAIDMAVKALSIDIIRCKDCKHNYLDGIQVRFNRCELNHSKVHADDWFCADGERKE